LVGINSALGALWKVVVVHNIGKYIFSSAEEIAEHFSKMRNEGQTLVTTNGCFDLIHAGHMQYLEEASAMGDILIVGLNADKTVRKLKGPSRPIQMQDDRVSIVAGIRWVDGVFVFHEDDPCAFLDIIKPDIHIKGGDYTTEIIEKPIVEKHGGKIVIVSFKPGCSTSSIISKIVHHSQNET